VIICEIIVNLLVIVQNNKRCTVHVLKYCTIILHADRKERAVPSNKGKTCCPEAVFYLGCRMTEIISSSFNFWVSKGRIREVTLSKWPLVSMETPTREYKCKKIANFILWEGEEVPPSLGGRNVLEALC